MRWTSPTAALVAGTIVGLALGVAVLSSDDQRRVRLEPRPLIPPTGSAAAVDALLEAWERSRTETYVVEGVFTRRIGTASLQSGIYIAQRPPDRISVGAGSLSSRRGDTLLACGVASDGVARCRGAGAARPYAAEVARERRALLRLVRDEPGSVALYRVVDAGSGCFELTLRFGYPAPPYGDEARLCFDAVTGAPTESVVIHGDAIDRTIYEPADPTVADADLEPPDSLFAPTVGGR